jgi:hypothetical protein
MWSRSGPGRGRRRLYFPITFFRQKFSTLFMWNVRPRLEWLREASVTAAFYCLVMLCWLTPLISMFRFRLLLSHSTNLQNFIELVADHWPLSWASWIQYTPAHHTSFWCTSILSLILLICLPIFEYTFLPCVLHILPARSSLTWPI